MNRFRRNPRRPAFSLLEVLLALAILATVATVLSQMIYLTLRSVATTRDEPRGVLWCENRHEEIACGILSPTAVQDVPVPEDNDWIYSIDVQPAPFRGLLEVRVEVKLAASSASGPIVSMIRWIIDPSDTRFQPFSGTETEGTSEGSTSSSTSGGTS